MLKAVPIKKLTAIHGPNRVLTIKAPATLPKKVPAASERIAAKNNPVAAIHFLFESVAIAATRKTKIGAKTNAAIAFMGARATDNRTAEKELCPLELLFGIDSSAEANIVAIQFVIAFFYRWYGIVAMNHGLTTEVSRPPKAGRLDRNVRNEVKKGADFEVTAFVGNHCLQNT